MIERIQTGLCLAIALITPVSADVADDLPILRDLKSLSVHWPAAATGWTLQYSETLQPDSWIDVPPEAEILVMQGISTVSFSTEGSPCSSASRSSHEDKNKNAEQESGLNALPRVSHFGRSAKKMGSHHSRARKRKLRRESSFPTPSFEEARTTLRGLSDDPYRDGTELIDVVAALEACMRAISDHPDVPDSELLRLLDPGGLIAEFGARCLYLRTGRDDLGWQPAGANGLAFVTDRPDWEAYLEQRRAEQDAGGKRDH